MIHHILGRSHCINYCYRSPAADATLGGVFDSAYCTLTLNKSKHEVLTHAIYSRNRGAEVSIGSVPFCKKFLESKLSEFNGRFALIRGLPLQQRQLLRYCFVTTLIHLTRTLRSDDPSIMEVWDALVDAELASPLTSPVEGLVYLPLLIQLPMCLGGFGIPHYQTIVPSAYTSASSAAHQFLGKLGLCAPLHSVPQWVSVQPNPLRTPGPTTLPPSLTRLRPLAPLCL